MARSAHDGTPLSTQIVWYEGKVVELETKIERLRQIIADAPHAHNCAGWRDRCGPRVVSPSRYVNLSACDCFKSKAGE